MTLLPTELLDRSHSLPLKPAPVQLDGRFVRLTPLAPHHAPALFAHANGAPIELAERTHPAYDADDLIWRYLFSGPFANAVAFERYIDETIAGADRLALCVIEQES
ncbi:MAG TPA: hypothetical protein PL187_16450, partial [Caldilinea sp.]|nr:hypothetical protein [Caldilinea sp.]